MRHIVTVYAGGQELLVVLPSTYTGSYPFYYSAPTWPEFLRSIANRPEFALRITTQNILPA